MNIVVIISVLVGLSAAGFVWFGWDLLEAFRGRSHTAQPEVEPEDTEESE
ncbi:MAG: hypothetical protein U9Q79_04305 [Candidatus Hydrogenedentes bacterium]|nr:hypothetical protein [Candidatus Hydrogenedentota bacterium]